MSTALDRTVTVGKSDSEAPRGFWQQNGAQFGCTQTQVVRAALLPKTEWCVAAGFFDCYRSIQRGGHGTNDTVVLSVSSYKVYIACSTKCRIVLPLWTNPTLPEHPPSSTIESAVDLCTDKAAANLVIICLYINYCIINIVITV